MGSISRSDLREDLKDALDEKLRVQLRIATVKVENGLNQDVYVQIIAHRHAQWDSFRENVLSEFTVSAGSSESRTLTPETSGWLPYLTVNVRCTTAPTSGSVSVYRIRSKDDIDIIVNALAIRDTNDHNPSTDPNYIFWVEW